MKTIKEALEQVGRNNMFPEEEIVSRIDVILRQVKVAHWNVTGSNFISFHTFLGEVYEQLAGFQDRLAEALKTKGYIVSLLGAGYVEGMPPEPFYRMLGASFAELDAFGKKCIADCQDEVVKNILVDISEALGKWQWFIRSSFQSS